MRSAGPPVARRRRIVSVIAAVWGSCSRVAWADTCSTHPSMSASHVSSWASALCWAGVGLGLRKPSVSALCIASGSEGSTSRTAASMASVSMAMPRA